MTVTTARPAQPASDHPPSPRQLSDLDWAATLAGPHHPSPSSWADQVLYFLLVDRFSDGNEWGVPDESGQPSSGATPPLSKNDHGSVGDANGLATWRAAGKTWVHGNLKGVRSKLGYLHRLGVTTLWISPVLRQRPGTDDYHGYGTQDFLRIDSHFGTAQDLRDLVAAAHDLGIYVILDVVVNHAGNVFGYDPDVETTWQATSRDGTRWRDSNGAPTVPVDQPLTDPDAGVWPRELQRKETFTAKGEIRDEHWDDPVEKLEGDFYGYKDIHHGEGSVAEYAPSAALKTLIAAYSYWIAYADLDGFRIDTVKHTDPGATRTFVTAIAEFAATLGKDRFLQVGEIAEGDRSTVVRQIRETGLDAALGLGTVQTALAGVAKGWVDPNNYFKLFEPDANLGLPTHAWYATHFVTAYDDHDKALCGDPKKRFGADLEGQQLAPAAIALNVTTLGVPCVYYGSEQAFDGVDDDRVPKDFDDRYIREAMFGGSFGAFRSTGHHCFDEKHPAFIETAAVLAIRKAEPGLRRGRQYLRELSVDGITFWLPTKLGGARMTSLVAWSRILGGREVVVVINTDLAAERSAWVTVDTELNPARTGVRYLHNTDQSKIATTSLVTKMNDGRHAVKITVPACGVAVLGA